MFRGNSCMYEGRVSHVRQKPVRNSFTYGLYMFAIDVDELPRLDRSMISVNRRGVFSFYDQDHLKFIPGDQAAPIAGHSDLRVRLEKYLATVRPGFVPSRILLVTNLRVFGYVFNPVSFYFLFDDSSREETVRAVLVEVNNTYLEQKAFLIEDSSLEKVEQKLFYVSPFVSYDDTFHFRLTPPEDTLTVMIDSKRENHVEVRSVLKANRVPMSRWELVRLSIRYPLQTIRVIFLIHWQAMRLYLRGVPFFQKKATDDLIRMHAQRNHPGGTS